MSSTLRERNTIAVQEYYKSHKSSVAKQKSIRFLAEKGRVPKKETLLRHSIDISLLMKSWKNTVNGTLTLKHSKKCTTLKLKKVHTDAQCVACLKEVMFV